jgi:ABC-2 type transport system ATP-binding protein
MATPITVEAIGLRKRFGDVIALDGLDLAVPQGSVLGLLGPNGAGKTTAVSILTTLLTPDGGHAVVAGADVRREPQLVRRRIGLSGQYAAVDEVLTGRENLVMVGRLYGMTKSQAATRADALIDRFSLADAGNRSVKTYSGGMRRRLDLAAALIAEPPVLFLDEPTTGLDPRSRAELWDMIRELVDDGATLLLTTQYLEEADQLADEIVVIDHGRAIARGTADQLKSQVGQQRIELVVTADTDVDAAVAVLRDVCPVGSPDDIDVRRSVRTILAPAVDIGTLANVVAGLHAAHIAVSDLGLRRPTLDDVFLMLTGHDASGDNSDRSDA